MADDGSLAGDDVSRSSHVVEDVTTPKPSTQEAASQISHTDVAINVQSLVVEIRAPNPILPTDAILQPFLTPSKRKKNAFDPNKGYIPQPLPFQEYEVMSSKDNPFADHELPPEPEKPGKPTILPEPVVPPQCHVNEVDSLELPSNHRKHEYINIGCLYDLPWPTPIAVVEDEDVVWPRQPVRARVPEIVGNSPVIPLKNSRYIKGTPRKTSVQRPQPKCWSDKSAESEKPVEKSIQLQPAPGRTDIYMSVSDEYMTIHYIPKSEPEPGTSEGSVSDSLSSGNVGELKSNTKDDTASESITTSKIGEPEPGTSEGSASDSLRSGNVGELESNTKDDTASESITTSKIGEPEPGTSEGSASDSLRSGNVGELESNTKDDTASESITTSKIGEPEPGTSEGSVSDSLRSGNVGELESNTKDDTASESITTSKIGEPEPGTSEGSASDSLRSGNVGELESNAKDDTASESITTSKIEEPEPGTSEGSVSDSLRSGNVGELESNTKDDTASESITTSKIGEPEPGTSEGSASDSLRSGNVRELESNTKDDTASESITTSKIGEPELKTLKSVDNSASDSDHLLL